MIITNDSVFLFESEDARTLFESIYGKNQQEKVLGKQHFRLKDDTFLSIYPDGLKPKSIREHFASFMLGFIFLNGVDQNRNDTIETSSTMLGLVTQTCLAMSEILKLPLALFFEDIDEIELGNQLNDGDFEKIENPKGITLVIRDNWVETGLNTMDEFLQNGWVFLEKFDPTLIGEEPIEEQNDFILKPTSLFLHSLNLFKIEEFQPSNKNRSIGRFFIFLFQKLDNST